MAHLGGLCEGESPVTSGFPLHRSLAWEMFSFDDVIRVKSEGICPVEHPGFIHLSNDKRFTRLPANIFWKSISRISPFAWPSVRSSPSKPKQIVLAQTLSHSSFFQVYYYVVKENNKRHVLSWRGFKCTKLNIIWCLLYARCLVTWEINSRTTLS